MENKFTSVVLAIAAVAMVVGAIVFQKDVNITVSSTSQPGESLVASPNLGTNLTQNASNQKYTDSADFYQNVQAMAERMTGLPSSTILQADSAGHMQTTTLEKFVGNLTGIGAFTAAGDVRIKSVAYYGSIVTLGASSSVSAANVCDTHAWNIMPVSTTPTHTLPPADDVFLDCLTANGDTLGPIHVFNNSNTSTRFAAGTSSTLTWSTASSTLEPGDQGMLWGTRTSTTGGMRWSLILSAN